MATPIIIGWWSFLLVAFLVTAIDVYLLLRVISLCRQIRTLSAKTLPAAVGIAKNTRADDALGRTVQLAVSLAKKTRDLQTLTGVIRKKLIH
jgi:hypothetical protein